MGCEGEGTARRWGTQGVVVGLGVERVKFRHAGALMVFGGAAKALGGRGLGRGQKMMSARGVGVILRSYELCAEGEGGRAMDN